MRSNQSHLSSSVFCHALRPIDFRFSILLLLMALGFSSEILAISVGDRVNASSNLNVRPSPGSSTTLGTQDAGSQGIVVSGPQVASLQGTSYSWWQINWDDGPDGWSIESGLTAIVPSPTITSVTPSPVIGSTNNQTVTISEASFVNEPTVIVTWSRSGGPVTLGSGQVAFNASTQLQMLIATGIDADSWTVRVINADGKTSNKFRQAWSKI